MKPFLCTVGKTIFWIALLLMFAYMEKVAVYASSLATVSVEPYANFVNVGETFTIRITLTDVQNLYGVEIVLYWNVSVLQIVNVNVQLGVESHPDGVLHENIQFFKNETNQTEGKYFLAASSASPAAPFSGSGTIVIITFNVTKVGYSKLDLETELADWPPPGRQPPISWPIAHNTVDGVFGRHIEISASPTIVDVGRSVSINGFVIPAQANMNVTAVYRREGEAGWDNLSTTRTNEQGNYQFTWKTRDIGKFEVRVTALIENVEVTSSIVFVTVKSPEPSTSQYIIIVLAVILIAVVIVALIYLKRK